MQRSAYVTGLGVCLPNAPVANDEIEQALGRLSRQSVAVKRRVLINSGIKSRHYAIDPGTGRITHTNAEMTAEAVRAACRSAGLSPADIACLACGTSSADQLIPSHASMVHAALDCPPCEVIATSGVCCSGVSAFKYGFLNVAGGISRQCRGDRVRTGLAEHARFAFRATAAVRSRRNRETDETGFRQ